MRFVVTRQVSASIRWNPSKYIGRIVKDQLEPVGTVDAVSHKHAREKALAKYPQVEPELLRVVIA
jgi:hypothetical protein